MHHGHRPAIAPFDKLTINDEREPYVQPIVGPPLPPSLYEKYEQTQ
jgi:hypothetical protein